MVRDHRISLGFNESEYNEIKKRADKAHLKLGDYIRWYLFDESKGYYSPTLNQSYTIPYKAAPEVIERIKAGKEAYVDPYQEARLEAMETFKKVGGLGQLHNSITQMARGGRLLKPIPKGDLKAIKKQKEKRKHVVNQALDEIKKKNIEAGILNNE